MLQANLETFSSGGQSYSIKVAALDTTNDSTTNYDTVVMFDANHGSILGPFTAGPLGTGPAYIQPSTKISGLFYLEGHSNKAGVRYFVSQLAPDLSPVRIARSSTSFIPRNAAVLADGDDINNNVGFWQPQADFRIVERIDGPPSTFTSFPDTELEAIYEELVRGVCHLPDERRPARDFTVPEHRFGDGLHRAAGRLRASIPGDRSAAGDEPHRPKLDRPESGSLEAGALPRLHCHLPIRWRTKRCSG